MTAPTLIPTPLEMARPTGDEVVVLPEDVSAEQHSFQDTSPSEALFVRDAVVAMGDEIATHYPEDVVQSVRVKAAAAAYYSVTLSMRSVAIQSVIDPGYAGYEAYASPMGAPVAEESTTPVDAPDQPYVPDFDADDAAELSGRAEYLVENALRLGIDDLTRQARNQRAEAAIAAAEAATTPEKEQAFEANETAARDACRNATFDELLAAHQPIYLSSLEAAFIAEAVRQYDPAAHRAKLARELHCVDPLETIAAPPRLASVAVQEVTGHDSLRDRIAVWAAGLVARFSSKYPAYPAGYGGMVSSNLAHQAYSATQTLV